MKINNHERTDLKKKKKKTGLYVINRGQVLMMQPNLKEINYISTHLSYISDRK